MLRRKSSTIRDKSNIPAWTGCDSLAGMRTHEALIERTRASRYAKGMSGQLYAKRCEYCGANALKANGYKWCQRHQPGHARDRKPYRGDREALKRMATANLRELGARRVIGDLVGWAPIARIEAQKPMHKRTIMLSDVVAALIRLAAQDHEPWADIVSRMRDAGLIQPGDPSLADYAALVSEGTPFVS